MVAVRVFIRSDGVNGCIVHNNEKTCMWQNFQDCRSRRIATDLAARGQGLTVKLVKLPSHQRPHSPKVLVSIVLPICPD